MKPELVSFKICPFVQRSVILLQEKKIDYDVTYIDLMQPPAWFNRISPLGKVPLLKIDGQLLFESAIINEYLDEVYPPALIAGDPLSRARERGWIEFGSNLLFEQAKVAMAESEEHYQDKRRAYGESLLRLAEAKGDDAFFSSERFSLVDSAYAPLFMRFEILKRYRPDLGEIFPESLTSWQDVLLERRSVMASVVDDFEQLYVDYFRAKGSHILVRDAV